MLFSRMHNIFLGRPISLKRNLTQRKMWRTWRTTKKWQFCDGHLVQDGWRWHVHFVVMVEGVHISSFRSKKTFLSACCNFLTASSALFSGIVLVILFSYLTLIFDYRVSHDMFDTLVKLLAPNPLFQSKGRKPQRHLKHQLGTFLICYGQLASPIQDTALKVAIGAGTVVLYCRRVTRAIRELRLKFGGWVE
ncbi:hypothetical protein E1B28_010930 [Marasmius oreades]|uniref:Uncharacterized protein n=1 Tax=Marasmius oreades TaxID=181124 RepID=A0A9P7RT04_9AGAR|nr:uncharacterized protein E1B28_010930 [Marasmius oreades]KAG7089231.1 hypothetical protein E1B28_010930 [Marasmius oreades]